MTPRDPLWIALACPSCGAAPGVPCRGDDLERFAHPERKALAPAAAPGARRSSIVVVVTWSAGAVRLTPIAYDPPDRLKALAILSTVYPTWQSAKEFCDAQGIFISNGDGVSDAIAVESEPHQQQLPGVSNVA